MGTKTQSFNVTHTILFSLKYLHYVTGFTFNFGALNTGTGNVNDVAEKGKPNDGFQFNFNKKTSSGSFFKLF